MPSASPAAYAHAVPCFPPSPASRCAAVAPRGAAPPTAPAAPKPGSRDGHTPVAIQTSAAAPTAPVTGGGAGSGKSRASARPAASAGRRTTAPSASRAARHAAHSTAAAMPCGAPPAAACAAPSPQSEACLVAADASHWRRSVSRLSEKAPSARDGTPGDAQGVNVWTAKRLRVALRDVRAVHTGPTPARPSVTWWLSGRRRSR